MSYSVVRQLDAMDQQARELRRRRTHIAQWPPLLSPSVFTTALSIAGARSFLDVRALCGVVLTSPVVVGGEVFNCRACAAALSAYEARNGTH